MQGWGNDSSYLQLPGGAAIQFDTTQLTLGDFRRMRENYQLGSSIRLLTFMMQQTEWTLKGGKTEKARKSCEENLRKIWTPLIRSMCSSFPFGYSANVVEWETEPGSNKWVINKIKDLVHEDVDVHWDYQEAAALPGAAPGSIRPKVKVFDGIEQWGVQTVPVTNAFWYPLLMENGDYKGTKLLRSAFQPWFFSNLIHMFANRYYERFGEPVPIGRAPYDETIDINGADVPGNEVMKNILGSLRNRSAVVLPNQRTGTSLNGTDKTFDYQIEFLESQMRGADWERHLTRLDEEMSLALFTPLLVMRTTSEGGFNAGAGQTQTWLWMLNALTADFGEYINRYIIAPMVRYNFGINDEPPRLEFRKLGTAQQETLRAIVQSLLANDKVKIDYQELGDHIGLDLQENPNPQPQGKQQGDPNDPNEDGELNNGNVDKRVGRPERIKDDDPKNNDKTKATTKPITQRIVDRVRSQATKASDSSGAVSSSFEPSLGFARQIVSALEACGVDEPSAAQTQAYALVRACSADLVATNPQVNDYMKHFESVLEATVEKVTNG
jgi:hypothetical protein